MYDMYIYVMCNIYVGNACVHCTMYCEIHYCTCVYMYVCSIIYSFPAFVLVHALLIIILIIYGTSIFNAEYFISEQ